MKKIFSLVLAFVLLFGLCACGSGDEKKDEFYDAGFFEEFNTGDEIVTVELKKNPQAELTLTDGSKIVIELCYDVSPNAVSNFVAFADEKIYEKMGFTDVRNNCIVMTGAMEGEFSPPYYVQDEVKTDSENKLPHVRGTVSMIRTSSADTLTGQFFILTKDQTHFDSRFTSFGTVIEGLENIDKIAASEKDDSGKISAPIGIKEINVKTFGEKIPKPTIILK